MVLEDDNSPGLAIGHPVPLLGGGFEGDPRLIRLLEGALRDLDGRIPPGLFSSARTGFYLAIPSAHREHEGVDLIPEEDRDDYIEQLGDPTAVDELARARGILDAALRLADFPLRFASASDLVHVALSGHTAAIELYQRAQADLESGRLGVAIVAAVDSLVTTTTLSWFHATDRLKSAKCPAGLSPGEAAVIVVLAPGGRSRQQGPARPSIDNIVTVPSATRFMVGDLADGAGQFEVLRTLTNGSSPAGGLWLIVDQNGEVFRATDWGRTLVRYRAIRPIDDPTIWYPAASFGDTGAAAGALATCMAIRAHERGYAASAHAIVMTNSDGASRAGCVISAAEE